MKPKTPKQTKPTREETEEEHKFVIDPRIILWILLLVLLYLLLKSAEVLS